MQDMLTCLSVAFDLPPVRYHTKGYFNMHSNADISQLNVPPNTGNRKLKTGEHTYIPFNGPFSGTIRVSRYQKGKTDLDFTEARDSEWQWHQLGHMQVCTLLQTDNHAKPHRSVFFTGRMPFLPPNQQRQSTEGKALKAEQNRKQKNRKSKKGYALKYQ